MNINEWIRQAHRWVSIAFTAGVILNVVVMAKGQPPAWVGVMALIPLVLLLITGLYLFVLPYSARRRGGGRADSPRTR